MGFRPLPTPSSGWAPGSIAALDFVYTRSERADQAYSARAAEGAGGFAHAAAPGRYRSRKVLVAMPDDAAARARRMARFIKPLRVKPGTPVDLARDFDPRYKAGVTRKKEGVEMLRAGNELLA